MSRNREKIEVLANIAGVMDAFQAVDLYTDSEWDHIMGVNLTVPTRMMRAVLPMMKAKKHGVIVNVAGRAGLSGAVAGVAYTASKHGLLGVTKNTAWRFHGDGIRCNAILPGGRLFVESDDKTKLTEFSYRYESRVVDRPGLT